MVAFKDRLLEALEIRNMKQIDLSAKTGIGKSSISQWLSGRNEPNNINIRKLSIALDVSPAWLMGYEDVEMDKMSEEEEKRQSLTIEAEMAEMMLKKISELYRTLSFQQQVDLFEIARKMEVENENAK